MAKRGALAAVVIALVVAPAAQARITNGCVNSKEKAAAGDCHRPSFSADSRFEAFDSNADNLAAGDDNGKLDVFLRDRKRGRTELVSGNAKGHAPAGASFDAAISADGRYVAFVSVAPGLVRGVKGGKRQVYVFDRKTGKTRLASVGTNGKAGDGGSDQPAISADGSRVAFRSGATNLVAGDTNRSDDIFVRDLRAGNTVRASTGPNGEQDTDDERDPSISDDGTLVAFESGFKTVLTASKDNEIYVKDLSTGALELISKGLDGGPGDDFDEQPQISGNGRYVVFSSISNNLVAPANTEIERDIFVRDRVTQTTTRASVDAAGALLPTIDFNPSISADGGKVAFIAEDTFVDIEVRDLQAQTTTLVTPHTHARGNQCSHRLFLGCGDTSTPVLSPSGDLVGFEAAATHYTADDAGKFIQVLIARL